MFKASLSYITTACHKQKRQSRRTQQEQKYKTTLLCAGTGLGMEINCAYQTGSLSCGSPQMELSRQAHQQSYPGRAELGRGSPGSPTNMETAVICRLGVGELAGSRDSSESPAILKLSSVSPWLVPCSSCGNLVPRVRILRGAGVCVGEEVVGARSTLGSVQFS